MNRDILLKEIDDFKFFLIEIGFEKSKCFEQLEERRKEIEIGGFLKLTELINKVHLN